MTLANKLQRVLNTKGEIKQAIEDKGVAVGNAPFDEYPNKIRQIQTGSGSAECVDGWRRPCCWAPFPQKDENTDYFMGLVAVEDTDNEVVSLKWEAGTRVVSDGVARSSGVMTDYWRAPSEIYGNELGEGSVAVNSTSLFAVTYKKVLEYNKVTGEFVREICDIPLGLSWAVHLVADDNTLLVGNSQDTYESGGKVTVVDLTSRTIQTIIDPSPENSPSADFFGASVALTQEYIIASAPRESPSWTDHAGVVYVFNRSNLSLVKTITAPAISSNEFFGIHLATDGVTLAISALGSDAVYLYNLSDIDTGPNTIYYYGAWGAIDVYAGRVYIGISGSSVVHVHDATTGTFIQSITGWSNSGFGATVSVSESTIAIGAPYSNYGGSWSTGLVYLYNVDGTPQGEVGLPLEYLENGLYIGDRSIKLSGGNLYVGSFRSTPPEGSQNDGTVFVFDAAARTFIRRFLLPSQRRIVIGPAEYLQMFEVNITEVKIEDTPTTNYTFSDGTLTLLDPSDNQPVYITLSGTDGYLEAFRYTQGGFGPGSTLSLIPDGDEIVSVAVLHVSESGNKTFITDFTYQNGKVTLGATVPEVNWSVRGQYLVAYSLKAVIRTNSPVTIDWGDGTVLSYPLASPSTRNYKMMLSVYDYRSQTVLDLPTVSPTAAGLPISDYSALSYLNLTIDSVNFIDPDTGEKTGVDFSQTDLIITLNQPVPDNAYEIELNILLDDFRVYEIPNGGLSVNLESYYPSRPPYVTNNSGRLLDSQWSMNGTTLTLSEPWPSSPTTVVYTSITGSAVHRYDYQNNSLIDNLTGQCTNYKQAIITLTPDTGNLFVVDISGKRPDYANDNEIATTQWLDIEVNAEKLAQLIFYSTGDSGYYIPES